MLNFEGGADYSQFGFLIVFLPVFPEMEKIFHCLNQMPGQFSTIRFVLFVPKSFGALLPNLMKYSSVVSFLD